MVWDNPISVGGSIRYDFYLEDACGLISSMESKRAWIRRNNPRPDEAGWKKLDRPILRTLKFEV